MAATPVQFFSEKLEEIEKEKIVLERKINVLKKELELYAIQNNAPKLIDGEYDVIALLGDEEYRLKVAMKFAKTNAQIAKLLGLGERSIYRLKEKYKL